MIEAEMGKVYFQIDGTTEGKEKLDDFFKQCGFREVYEEPLSGEEYFKRTTRYANNNGLGFYVIWFVNVAHIRFGDWASGYMESSFTKIVGSYLQDVDHSTFNFMMVDKTTLKISLPNV